MNCYVLLALIPIVLNYANEIIIKNDQQYSPSILSIKDFVLTLNFGDAVTDDRRLQTFLEIYADNQLYNITLGTMLLNGSNTFTFSHYNQEDTTIKNSFDTITINGLFVFQYYGVSNVDILRNPLTCLTANNYTSDDWIYVTQNGVNDIPNILWNVTFQYKKSCQNLNYGFYCDNQNSSTSMSTTTTSTTMTSSPLMDCYGQIHDLQKDRDNERDKKNLYFWLWIGFIVLSIILFILMILFCCCWFRDRGRFAQYEEKPPKPNRDRRDRVDIVHPHSYPEEQRVERNVTVRQRTLPPYRPPQQPHQQQRSAQGPIDASSNVIPPRTQYSQQHQPSRPFQYPSDSDDWSIPPNEHVV